MRAFTLWMSALVARFELSRFPQLVHQNFTLLLGEAVRRQGLDKPMGVERNDDFPGRILTPAGSRSASRTRSPARTA